MELLDEVKITAIDVEGFIDRIEQSVNGLIMYRVIYWMDGKRQEVWLYDCEVKKIGGMM